MIRFAGIGILRQLRIGRLRKYILGYGISKKDVSFSLKRVKIKMISDNRNIFYTFFIIYFNCTGSTHKGRIGRGGGLKENYHLDNEHKAFIGKTGKQKEDTILSFDCSA